MAIPKKSNRISRREAAGICSHIRACFMELRSGYATSVSGYVVFRDWTGELSRADEALIGWVECWKRFETGLDLTPHDRLRKKLTADTPLTIAEIDAALGLLRKQEKLLPTMPRDFIHDKTNTELIAIGLEQIGAKEQVV